MLFRSGSKTTHYFTDHSSLIQLFKKPFAEFTNKKLLRTFLRIQHLRIQPQHIAGKTNTFTDYFSRYDLPPPMPDEEFAYWQASYLGMEEEKDIKAYHLAFDAETFSNLACNLKYLQSQALLDASYQQAVEFFRTSPENTPNDPLVKTLKKRADDVEIGRAHV